MGNDIRHKMKPLITEDLARLSLLAGMLSTHGNLSDKEFMRLMPVASQTAFAIVNDLTIAFGIDAQDIIDAMGKIVSEVKGDGEHHNL